MDEIALNNYCRLCLKESFSLKDIYTSHSPSGDLLYRVLNNVYDLQICPDDGLPPLICSPCTWKMEEFNGYKENAHFAKAEIIKFLKEKSADSIGDCGSGENNGTSMDSDSSHSVQSNEIEIEEWQMPEELKRESMDMDGYGIESELNTNKNIVNVDNGSASSEVVPLKEEVDIVEWQMPEDLRAMDIENAVTEVQDTRNVDNADDQQELVKVEAAESEEGINNEGISSEQLTKSHQLPEVLNSDCDDTAALICSGESSSEESAEEPKCVPNDTEAGPSHSEAPLSEMKNRLKCDVCKKGFQFKCYLSRHVRIHYDHRLFSCGVCGKSFKQKSVRDHHELGHLKDGMNVGKGSTKKPFSCGICGRNFGSKSGLINHSYQHSKKYSCRTCGKSFGTNSALKNHLRVHTQEKPYECEKCLKSFNHKTNLTRHMVIHSSDKPFACDVCKKKFKTKGRKNEHEFVHLKKK